MKRFFFIISFLVILGLLAGCATPLTSAVEKRNIQEIKTLLDSGANINEPGGDPDRTPLELAIRYNYYDVAKLLIDRGADVNLVRWDAPLTYAAEVGNINMVNLLIEKGADVNLAGVYGSPLTEAARNGKFAIIERLLEKGADLDFALALCEQKGPQYWMTDYYAPCISTLKSIKVRREAKAQAQVQQVAKPGVSKEEIASIVQAAVEKNQKTRDRQAETAPAAGDILDPSSIAPPARIMGENDLAVIIGIEGYQSLPKSDYSYDDAKLVKEYAKALGFRERNIELITDERATKSSIEKSLEAWLKNKARADSRVFVYYSGHGAPDPATGEAYLVPYDGDPNYISVTGYPLKRLYENLGRLPASEVTVVLDACFSGAGGRSVLAKGARPLVMTTAALAIPGNIAVLSATQASQISSSSPEKGHGIFTYNFLKALKNGKKSIADIYSYITPLVEDEAKALNIEQSPALSPDPEKIRGRFFLRK